MDISVIFVAFPNLVQCGLSLLMRCWLGMREQGPRSANHLLHHNEEGDIRRKQLWKEKHEKDNLWLNFLEFVNPPGVLRQFYLPSSMSNLYKGHNSFTQVTFSSYEFYSKLCSLERQLPFLLWLRYLYLKTWSKVWEDYMFFSDFAPPLPPPGLRGFKVGDRAEVLPRAFKQAGNLSPRKRCLVSKKISVYKVLTAPTRPHQSNYNTTVLHPS